MEINSIAKQIHQNAKNHGWWDDKRSGAEVIALCHSELSEALEAMRKGKPYFYIEEGKPEGIATEMVDCVIRIFDFLAYHNIDIEQILEAKHEFNKSRPYKHGKNF